MTTTLTTGFTTPVDQRRHRLHYFAGRAHQVLDSIDDTRLWAMTPAEVTETLAELSALSDRLAAHQLALVVEADGADLAKGAGCTNTAAWVRSVTGLTSRSSSGLVRQAKALARHPVTADALTRGVIRVEQASVIVKAVDALPAEVAHLAPEGEAHLVKAAREHDARALETLGKRLLEVVAPDQADALIAKRLEAQEREADKDASLSTWSDGHGSRYFKGKIPERHAAMLDAALEAIANPGRPDPIDREGISSQQVRGRAFCELIEHLDITGLPSHGGVNAQVVVFMDYNTLVGGLKAAGILGTDLLISPAQARRLAAAAGIIPVVLGDKSQVLDLGRRRFFTRPQRVAMAIRQQGLCNIDGCQIPATWCDANHRIPYAQGGQTTLDNGELICPRHHTLVHQGFTYPRRT